MGGSLRRGWMLAADENKLLGLFSFLKKVRFLRGIMEEFVFRETKTCLRDGWNFEECGVSGKNEMLFDGSYDTCPFQEVF